MTVPVETNSTQTGVLSAVLAYTIWGLFPIYFLLVRDVATEEVLVHRIIWAVPVGALIIWARKQWPEVWRGLTSPSVLKALALTSAIIAINWLVYIAAVQNGKIFQASLGYYINPLIYVLVGVVVLGERLRAMQGVAVLLATIGVMVLTIYGGTFPIISITVAITFTIYGYVRKRVDIGAMPGLFIETLILAPFSAGFLLWLISQGEDTFTRADPGILALLLLAGLITVVPLLFFAIAARRLALATIGFLQFIGPTLQFMIGLASGETFTIAHQICFAFIWLAVAVFAWDAWRSRPVKQAA